MRPTRDSKHEIQIKESSGSLAVRYANHQDQATRRLGHQTTRSFRISDMHPRGFTLLEVVFALALTVLLLGSLLASLDLYRRLSTAGRDDVQKAQLVRALFRKMELDIRSCVYQPPKPDNGSGSGGQEESSGSEESTVTEIDPAAAFSADSVGIVGDSTTLVIHTQRPSREVSSVPVVQIEVLPPPSEQKSVAWFLAVPGADGLSGAAASVVAADGTAATSGLSRLEGDRLTTAYADAYADLTTLAANTRLLASEVGFLQFRYFDGVTWYDVWDTTITERLPNAIEITLGLNPLAGTTAGTATGPQPVDAGSGLEMYRYVVAVPLADPYMLEEPVE